MVIKSVYIRAFKSIYEVSLTLNPKINVMIGANESGKTNILKALEAFRADIPFDSSLTCQYSNNYYMGKCPEISLEFSIITKENRQKLVKVSDAFKDVESFTIRRDAPELTDYHVMIGEREVENINLNQLLKILPKIIYFSNIPLLKNKVDYDSLISNSSAFLTEKNLLKIGGIEDYELLFEDSSRGRRAAEPRRLLRRSARPRCHGRRPRRAGRRGGRAAARPPSPVTTGPSTSGSAADAALRRSPVPVSQSFSSRWDSGSSPVSSFSERSAVSMLVGSLLSPGPRHSRCSSARAPVTRGVR